MTIKRKSTEERWEEARGKYERAVNRFMDVLGWGTHTELVAANKRLAKAKEALARIEQVVAAEDAKK